MEISLINSTAIPRKDKWITILRKKVKEFQEAQNGNKKDAILIILSKNEKYKGVDTAWRKICKYDIKKTPHVKVVKHEVGITIYLWWS